VTEELAGTWVMAAWLYVVGGVGVVALRRALNGLEEFCREGEICERKK